MSMSPDPRYRSQSPVRSSIPAAFSTTRRALPASPPVLYGTWSPSMPTLPPRGAAQIPLYTSSSLLRGRILPTRRSPVRMRLLSPPPPPENNVAVLSASKGMTAQEWQDYVRKHYPNHDVAELGAGRIERRQAVAKVFRSESRLVKVPAPKHRSGKASEMDKVDVSGWTPADDWNFGQISPSRPRYTTRSLSPQGRKTWWTPRAPDTRSALFLNDGTLNLQVGGDLFKTSPARPLATEQTTDRDLDQNRSLPSTRLSFDTPPRPRRSSSPNKEFSPAPELLPGITPRKDRGATSASMTLSLDLDYRNTLGGGPDVRQQFENDLISDLAAASDRSEEAFRITSVSPGSIIVVVDVLATASRKGGSPDRTVEDLMQQLRNPRSALLAGKITSKTKDLAPTDHDQGEDFEDFDDIPLVGLDSVQEDFVDPVFTRTSHTAQRATGAPARNGFPLSALTGNVNPSEADNQGELLDYPSAKEITDLTNTSDRYTNSRQPRKPISNVLAQSPVNNSLPGEAHASEPDIIEDSPMSFFDSIRQSPLISWLYPKEDSGLITQVQSTPVEEELSSRGQVRESMPPSGPDHADWKREQQQVAQLKAQVAELQSAMASLKRSTSPTIPQSTPAIGPSMSRPLPRPASDDKQNVFGAMSPESYQHSPHYAPPLTLENRGVDRPPPVSSPNSVQSGPASASSLTPPSKSPSTTSTYRIDDREYVGREYRAGPRLPPASGRVTLEDRQERRQ